MKGKYYFTQLSAPVVGLAVWFILLALVGKFHIVETDNINNADIVIISILFLTIPLTMVLWGKVLVFLGFLEKDEAKGYPWSKPWKNNKK